MTLNKLLIEKNLTKYQLSNLSKVPYSTISDLFNEKTDLKKCSVDVVYKIAKVLNISIEELIVLSLNVEELRLDFETFKGNMRHEIHFTDDLSFIEKTLSSDQIDAYLEKKWYPEALYTLAMVDYLSRINEIPLYNKYDSLRKAKLKRIHYPASLIIAQEFKENKKLVEEYFERSIPEFKRFNIVENEIRNVA
ncbi:MAG: helix-turn-helix transcriptional regulator [Erysipelotrichaceae bacterium]|nr:helix-turn-helix transcriptional regulator [Erysipelotrichaceae bacterium]